MNLPAHIATELQISVRQIDSVLQLFAEDATIPFIARYRKERTGGLDEEILRKIEERYNYLLVFNERKDAIIKSIEEQGKLTDELKKKIENATKLQELEDLYLPFKPKRRTKGTIAKEKGLEPLAQFIIDKIDVKFNLFEEAAKYINTEKEVNSEDDALNGAKDIIAEWINETASVREKTRNYITTNSLIESKKIETTELKLAKEQQVYEIYFDFKISLVDAKPYQILAINRAENEGFLRINLDFEKESLFKLIGKTYLANKIAYHQDYFDRIVKDSFTRLIFPSVERDLRNELTIIAENHAIEIFSKNLKQLLLQPPILGRKILGIDPGFVSGSKIAIIDETGKYLEGQTIYPHPPQGRKDEAKATILKLIKKHNVKLIGIGNGTASRETEFLITELIKENNLNVNYLIVSEAGASVYSASPLAKEEFPDLEASQRGNISIARRILDPLSELVKIEPKAIGVGLYQHDVDQKMLSKKLDDVVISAVNFVGVDLNTASVALLSYVSGLGKPIAKRIVQFREEFGSFKSRIDLLKVKGLGEKAFEQAAGFLKIVNGENPLDNTFIHPESYEITKNIISEAKIDLSDKSVLPIKIENYLKNGKLEVIAKKFNVGIPTLTDIFENLKKPGRDPRENLPKPILRNDILSIDDLQIGTKLKGTVRNVVDFGAFVDIGLKNDALLHISEIANKFIKSPLDVLNVGDVIDVNIISIDKDKGRVAISMKK